MLFVDKYRSWCFTWKSYVVSDWVSCVVVSVNLMLITVTGSTQIPWFSSDIARSINGHNFATCQPIPVMFGSRLGFSGTADQTAPFPVGSYPRWRPAAILRSFKWPNLWNTLPNSLYVCTQTILFPRSLIYNDGDSKVISRWRVTSRPTV